MKKFSKNIIGSAMEISLGGSTVGIINDTDLPCNVKSMTGTMVGVGLLKRTGKKLKVI